MAERIMKIKIPVEFVRLCADDDTTPEEVIRGFIADLCRLDARPGFISNGSDERLLAKQYYDRVGYSDPARR